jgi:two-component system, cell cycle sensor histidine kinase and response regulator CckA
MPEMNGPELVRRIASSGSSPRVLYMSGYTDSALPAEDVIESRDSLLQKPFTPDVLLRRVREAIDRPMP